MESKRLTRKRAKKSSSAPAGEAGPEVPKVDTPGTSMSMTPVNEVCLQPSTKKRVRKSSSTITAGECDPKVRKTEKSLTISVSPEEEVCHFEKLPDNLTVNIFRHLSLEDVAELIPQVCQKWSCLAVSENLWDDVRISYATWMSERQKKLFFKYWKMAPKLHYVTFEIDWRDCDLHKMLCSKPPTDINTLHFIYDNMPPEVMFSLLRLYKDSLEVLVISDTYTPYVDSDVARLWRHIQCQTKLRHLSVDGSALLYYKYSFKKKMSCWSTLQILDVKDCAYDDMDTVVKLIAVNPNWKEVYLADIGFQNIQYTRREVKALSKCKNLETVQLPFCKELKFLFNCEKLDALILDCGAQTAKEINAVVNAMPKDTAIFPNLKSLKMIGPSSSYVKLLRSLLTHCPRITLLNLVSCNVAGEVLLDTIRFASGLETLILHEIDAENVNSLLREITINEMFPQLKEVLLTDCSCSEETNKCVKDAVSQFREKHMKVKVRVKNMICKCHHTDTNSGKALEEQNKNPLPTGKKAGKNTKALKGGNL